MVCQNCAVAGAAGAGLGAYFYNRALENPNTFLNSIILKFNAFTVSAVFAGAAYLTSAGAMSFLAYWYGGKVLNSIGFSCHDEYDTADTSNTNNHKDYVLFTHHSVADYDLIKEVNVQRIPTDVIMVDNNNENNSLIASTQGSKIFIKGGVNYVSGNRGEDKFFFSMCSTKVYSEKTNVIDAFEEGKDKIYLFCSKRTIEKEDLAIYYNEQYNATFLTIANNPSGEIAIAFMGEHPELLNDVYLNENWADHVI
ncbi:hypothetical protein [endosymbiont of Acanthamoeba sp. UWC8]|uniref:hypothetical protein n=1 Tax=endosymbiont of Acanthamoeba sp. UWC8 TaxID=86106 RepID=UPI0011DCC8B9|nr:hypothetical protein [endosymbiont of Acanthamoeba sp. UWC8]